MRPMVQILPQTVIGSLSVWETESRWREVCEGKRGFNALPRSFRLSRGDIVLS